MYRAQKLVQSLARRIIPVMALAVAVVPYPVWAYDGPYRQPYAEEMIADGLIVRPLSLGATAIGAGVFIVTLPFSALGGNVGGAAHRLVVEPAQYTFHRCLGCFREREPDLIYDSYRR